MIKRIGYYILTLIIILAVIIFFLHREKEYPNESNRTVYIKKNSSGFQLIRNGKPFYIKGASGKSYIKELAEAGGNTLRLYDTINLQKTLDEAHKYNIAVIVDIPMPRFRFNQRSYLDSAYKKDTRTKVVTLVNKFKDHPSLLFWNLGNELIYPIPFNKVGKNFVDFINELIDLIHQEDINHLVGTTIAGPSLKQSFLINRYSPNFDLVGYNAFSMIKKVKLNNRKISFLSSTVPYYISEWGINGPWEASKNKWMSILEPSSTEKGEHYKTIFNSSIRTDDQCLGSLAFYWGNKTEGTPTWFNIFDENGRKSQIYYSLAEVWENTTLNTTPPQIEEMQLDGKTDKNLVFKVGEMVSAEVLIEERSYQNLQFKWVMFENGWGIKKWTYSEELNEFVFPVKVTDKNKIKVRMPKKEGAYRLFVYVYDTSNNFATANIPFYVFNQNE